MLELTLVNLQKVVWIEWDLQRHELVMYVGPPPFEERNSLNLGPLGAGDPLTNTAPCNDMDDYLLYTGFMNLITGNKFEILKQKNEYRYKGNRRTEIPVKILMGRQDFVNSDEYLDFLTTRKTEKV